MGRVARHHVRVIGWCSPGAHRVDIDFRPANGLLYALTNEGGTGRLYTIDPASGAATFRATLTADTVNDPTPTYTALSGTSFGVDFNPVPDRLRVVSNGVGPNNL